VDQYKDLAADVYDLSLQTGMVNATSKSSGIVRHSIEFVQ